MSVRKKLWQSSTESVLSVETKQYIMLICLERSGDPAFDKGNTYLKETLTECVRMPDRGIDLRKLVTLKKLYFGVKIEYKGMPMDRLNTAVF